jgi:hypothetical protein
MSRSINPSQGANVLVGLGCEAQSNARRFLRGARHQLMREALDEAVVGPYGEEVLERARVHVRTGGVKHRA